MLLVRLVGINRKAGLMTNFVVSIIYLAGCLITLMVVLYLESDFYKRNGINASVPLGKALFFAIVWPAFWIVAGLLLHSGRYREED